MSADDEKNEPNGRIHRIFLEEPHLIDEALQRGIDTHRQGILVVMGNRPSPTGRPAPCSLGNDLAG